MAKRYREISKEGKTIWGKNMILRDHGEQNNRSRQHFELLLCALDSVLNTLHTFDSHKTMWYE